MVTLRMPNYEMKYSVSKADRILDVCRVVIKTWYYRSVRRETA